MPGPHDDLPPGRRRRGDYVLAGRISPQDAHPYEIAYAVRHIASHPSLEADAFRRTREEQVLAEVRATLGAEPWVHFGPAALAALAASGGGADGCLRCRANLIARVRRLSPPADDPETSYLLGGEGCARCRRSPPGPAARQSTTAAGGARSTALRTWAELRAEVARLTTVAESGVGGRPIPTLYDEPVHRDLRA